MSPFLSWIDHDPKARERSHQILSLFSEKESRDEMGMGTIRDALSELLFPGTSTIQTRLRYFLFIPWTYSRLEHRSASSPQDFLAEGRKLELQMLDTFDLSQDVDGLIGKQARATLQRLPSSIYWAGLSSWGIRRHFSGGMEEYARGYRALKSRLAQLTRASRGDEDGDQFLEEGVWHRRAIELLPEGFPRGMNFRVSSDERDFLIDRIRSAHPRSLLAWFALHPEVELEGYQEGPWAHPTREVWSPWIQEVVEHGRLLSAVVRGAALLYNLQLAEMAEHTDLVDGYREDIADWAEALPLEELRSWDLGRLWEIVAEGGGYPGASARHFLESWVAFVLGLEGGISDSKAARELVRMREISLKKGRSRFTNTAARNQWQGGSGTIPMTFRWFQSLRLMRDLHGKSGGVDAQAQ